MGTPAKGARRRSFDPPCAGRYAPLVPVDVLISAFVTLLVVVDPIGLAPAFLAVTDGLSAAARRQVAWRASVTAAVILAGAALGGDWLLTLLRLALQAAPHAR